jgi:hypothetical protein
MPTNFMVWLHYLVATTMRSNISLIAMMRSNEVILSEDTSMATRRPSDFGSDDFGSATLPVE